MGRLYNGMTFSEYHKLRRAEEARNHDEFRRRVSTLAWAHHHPSGEFSLAEPSGFRPGDPDKVLVMAARYVVGLPLWMPGEMDCRDGVSEEEGE